MNAETRSGETDVRFPPPRHLRMNPRRRGSSALIGGTITTYFLSSKRTSMTSPTTILNTREQNPPGGMREPHGEATRLHSGKERHNSRCRVRQRGDDPLPAEILHSGEGNGDYAGKIS